jgi:hypothetical protein
MNLAEAEVKSLEDIQSIVRQVSLHGPLAGYSFIIRDTHGGIVLQATYLEADILTEVPEAQVTRKWLISPYATKSEIVQTAFKCILTSMEHRIREHFQYRGKRVFGPHFDVDDLYAICDRLDRRGSSE